MHHYPRITLAGLLLLYAIIATSCRGNDGEASTPLPEEEIDYSRVTTPIETILIYTDTADQYLSEEDESESYPYNYDVIGTDSLGHRLKGNVNMQGQYGSGVLVDKDGNEIKVKLQWVDFGELKAKDEQGNVWDLVVE